MGVRGNLGERARPRADGVLIVGDARRRGGLCRLRRGHGTKSSRCARVFFSSC